ncbi:MAG TPA: ferredoxin--NADP(+) reductase [Pusillimonas sp.]|nr:ferredoxin--NADP(+) reductase [Pusillimonas sp.]|tara:strand:- start:123 stop:908 length:786 start_codon:yes stop_codon:yes gene_type:complete
MSEKKYTRQKVLQVREWVPGKLLSMTVSRPDNFKFKGGQYARLGLPDNTESEVEPSVWRAYSMVNGPDQTTLEFYSIVVPEGKFSPQLAALKPDDAIYIDNTVFGFLTVDRFEPGGTLWMIATGTGLSAYLSMLNDPITWSRFDQIILVHGVRTKEELAYQDELQQWKANSGTEALPARFVYLAIPTRESLPGVPQARITTLIKNGELEELAHCTLDPQHNKIMLCGNPEMLADARAILKEKGFAVGRRGNPGNLAVENYW